MKEVDSAGILIQKEKELERAVKVPSKKIMEEMISDDFIELLSDGSMMMKGEVINEIIKHANSGLTFKSFEHQERMISEDVGVVLYKTRTDFEPHGEVNVQRSSFWKNEDGVWRNIFHQATKIQGK